MPPASVEPGGNCVDEDLPDGGSDWLGIGIVMPAIGVDWAVAGREETGCSIGITSRVFWCIGLTRAARSICAAFVGTRFARSFFVTRLFAGDFLFAVGLAGMGIAMPGMCISCAAAGAEWMANARALAAAIR